MWCIAFKEVERLFRAWKMDKQFLTIEHVAEILDVSQWTVRKWIKLRLISTYKFGGAVRLKMSDIINFSKFTPSKDELKAKN